MGASKIPSPCSGCRDGAALGFEFAIAFQPIVDVEAGRVFAYEALVRGSEGQPAASVLDQVTATNRYAFDQQCRVRAIEGAVAAGLLQSDAKLSINFMPNAVYSPKACIQLTLRTAAANDFPVDRLIFEFTENEEMVDPAHVAHIVQSYQAMGFQTALDDFGAGHAGLNLLARFQPNIIKLDMELVRGIDTSLPRRIIVGGIAGMCRSLGVTLVAEGVETEGELGALRDLGIRYIQGFLLARPAFAALPTVRFDAAPPLRACG
ncbi:MAG TPA: EAL domain-containing protein [Sphingomonadaceae bacterium]|jgi:EAL domain-containing protein (putative c-di-GMP-specific phosphodiesterase class I)|nr:EAL domain-containing protein [Sphingomonadaceae bacterium]